MNSIHRINIITFFIYLWCCDSNGIMWSELNHFSNLSLYAGDIPEDHPAYKTHIGLSLTQNNYNHIKHDITTPIPLPNYCVDSYQAEDVFQYIDYEKLPFVIDEIFRVLRPGVGFLRISVPDYRCDVLYDRSQKDASGKIVFDPAGGGAYVQGKIVGGGHVWFPTHEQVVSLLEKTKFKQYGFIIFLHYYDSNNQSITCPIDYSKGYVKRTPDHDERVKNPYRALSIVVDLYRR